MSDNEHINSSLLTKIYMETPEPQNIGKIVIALGLMITFVGIVIFVLGKLGLGKMPGDMKFGNDNFKVYFPIGTCILISVIMTLIMWLIKTFK